ncbi:MAG: HK97 gp10 family phage protein [Aeromonadaceae bacterium]
MESTAKDIVPVDTGALKQSIKYDVGANSEVSIGSELDYAVNVEYGIGQRPQPYLEPAVRENTDEIVDIMAQDIMRQIKEVLL